MSYVKPILASAGTAVATSCCNDQPFVKVGSAEVYVTIFSCGPPDPL